MPMHPGLTGLRCPAGAGGGGGVGSAPPSFTALPAPCLGVWVRGGRRGPGGGQAHGRTCLPELYLDETKRFYKELGFRR